MSRKLSSRTKATLVIATIAILFGISYAGNNATQIQGSQPSGARLDQWPLVIGLSGPDATVVPAKGTATGAAVVSVDTYQSVTRGCMEATCLTVGDGGVMAGTIPAPDGGTYYPQANTRYVSTVTTNSAIRVSNGTACNAFAGGVGRVLNEGSVLDFTTSPNPDGGVGDLTLACCAQTAGTVWQLCPIP